MIDYTKRAIDFLNRVNAQMSIEYVGHMRYFDDDEVKRDVYEITLTRNGKTYRFKYGQPITKTDRLANKYIQNENLRDGRMYPTENEILSVIQTYDIGTFSDFYKEYGYDANSNKTMAKFFAVQDEYLNIMELFGDVIDELRDIQ